MDRVSKVLDSAITRLNKLRWKYNKSSMFPEVGDKIKCAGIPLTVGSINYNKGRIIPLETEYEYVNIRCSFFLSRPEKIKCSKCIFKKEQITEDNGFSIAKESICSNKESERFGQVASRHYGCKSGVLR